MKIEHEKASIERSKAVQLNGTILGEIDKMLRQDEEVQARLLKRGMDAEHAIKNKAR